MDEKAPRKESPLDLFLRALSTGSSGEGIMRQEAAGQRSFVKSETLPTQMSREDRAALEAAGVVFGEVVQGDELFQFVQLPEGWKKTATEHPMHSDLLDDKGRKRAGIFYKAAVYDRDARLSCSRRFYLGLDYDKLDNGVAEAMVTDHGVEVFRTSAVSFDKDGEYTLRSAAKDQVKSEASAWLAEHWPDWENAAAYWD